MLRHQGHPDCINCASAAQPPKMDGTILQEQPLKCSQGWGAFSPQERPTLDADLAQELHVQVSGWTCSIALP